jgi:hypothetical protein
VLLIKSLSNSIISQYSFDTKFLTNTVGWAVQIHEARRGGFVILHINQLKSTISALIGLRSIISVATSM